MSDCFNNTMIEGAGGIVERHTADGVRIAIISRQRYTLERALPKGKRKSDESWQDTARREVEEETGIKAKIVGIVGTIFYLTDDGPKLVVFWRMRIQGPIPDFVPNDEVVALDWLLPEEALARLSHPDQADIVRKAFPALGSRPHNELSRVRRCVTRILQHRRLERLLSEIRAYREELYAQGSNSGTIDILKRAELAAEDGDIDCGWRFLQVARRLNQKPDKIRASAIALNAEANRKLDGWRKAAVNDLLRGITASCTGNSCSTSDFAKLDQAAEIRDEHFNNEAYKDSLNRSKAAWLAGSLLFALLAMLGITYPGYLAALVHHAPNDPQLPVLLSLAVLGWLGATISAVTNLPTPGISSRIPELVTTGRITMLRLMMGPAFAIITYFVTHSHLSQTIIAVNVNDDYIIVVIALAAGFSERLVLRVFRALEEKSGS